jgi:ribonucleoside-triphosphate reductase
MINAMIIKKNLTKEEFNPDKIATAIRKSAQRVLITLSDEDCKKVSDNVKEKIKEDVPVSVVHNMVECALDECGFHKVAESYRSYRNYKEDAKDIWQAVVDKTIELNQEPDRSNANCDSQLVSTKRILRHGEFDKETYKRFFLNPEERVAHEEGFIYIHDMKDRLSTYNCCLLNVGRIMKDGFRLANIDYTEPGSVASAIAVASDIISVTAGNQYGGLTWPYVDEDLSYYCQKSYDFYIDQYRNIVLGANGIFDEEKADKYAYERVKREIQQGYQGIEHTYNSVSSCRGDFPFISFSFGHGKDRWSKLVSKTILETRMAGQGKKGGKTPVLFPKLIFTYEDAIHGIGKSCEDVFDLACKCSKDTMYPDFLSLDAGYVGEMYKKTGKIITMMGKRKLQLI